MPVLTRVLVQAPVRVLDAGGWTDTWFAGEGSVCHLAVNDGTEVVALCSDQAGATQVGTVDLRVPSFRDRYRFTLDETPGRHPLLEAALRRWAPSACHLQVTVTSAVPPGSGLGTSASVVVALIAALQTLSGKSLDPAAVARDAHEIETIDVGLQSGVQDQIAAAYGGSNLITIDPYPNVDVRALDVPPPTWDALSRRLVTVYLGVPHLSSAVHDAVITRLTSGGGASLLAPLRAAAHDAAAALVEGDLEAFGRAMIANTEAQAALHPSLVNPLARKVFATAERFGAAGWKVNGAGGSITLIGPEDPSPLARALESVAPLSLLPLLPARRGVQVVDLA